MSTKPVDLVVNELRMAVRTIYEETPRPLGHRAPQTGVMATSSVLPAAAASCPTYRGPSGRTPTNPEIREQWRTKAEMGRSDKMLRVGGLAAVTGWIQGRLHAQGEDVWDACRADITGMHRERGEPAYDLCGQHLFAPSASRWLQAVCSPLPRFPTPSPGPSSASTSGDHRLSRHRRRTPHADPGRARCRRCSCGTAHRQLLLATRIWRPTAESMVHAID